MILTKHTFWVGLFCLLATWTTAQQTQPHVCGTTHPQELSQIADRLKANLETLRTHPTVAERNGVIKWIPIKFILMAKADGTGRINERTVLQQLCRLNADYAPLEMQFYLKDGTFKYVNNTALYENGSGAALTSHKVAGAVNVFFCKTATSGNNTEGLTLAYYTPGGDYIVSRNDAAGDNPTLTHEMGHFFSLMHTFYGWEGGSFYSSFPTWPCAPTFTPLPYGVLVEKVDGSNCQQAADMICDTRPNYILFGDCSYDGGAKDPMCVLIDPQENNYMSYFNNECQTEFTPQQGAGILADYLSPQRAAIRPNYTPNTSAITSAPVLELPANNAVLTYHTPVNLQWTAAAGATHYVLEIDRSPSFSLAPTRVVVAGTSYTISNLQTDKLYNWRVTPFHEANGCGVASFTSAVGKFTTGNGVSVPEIEGINEMTLVPNPAAANQPVTLQVNSDKAIDATVIITDVTGKRVAAQVINIAQGANTVALHTQLAAGMYQVTLQNAQGLVTKKLIIN